MDIKLTEAYNHDFVCFYCNTIVRDDDGSRAYTHNGFPFCCKECADEWDELN